LVTDKKILITAGPTWAPVDSVRVISNTATGETGILLAEQLTKQGAKVTLLLGPGEIGCKNKSVKVIRYKFFQELKGLLLETLKNNRYDALIHTAAVSDYSVKKVFSNKLRSGIKKLKIQLIPNPKLIDNLGACGNKIFKVGFKFEPELKNRKLIAKGKLLLKKSKLDLVVANSGAGKKYQAFIIEAGIQRGPLNNKPVMAKSLCRIMGDRL